MRKTSRLRIIELIGLPRTGKTTQTTALKGICEGQGLRTMSTADRERIAVIKTPPDERPMFDNMIAALAVEKYFEALKAGVDFLFLDRGWNDILIWAEFEYARHMITFSQREALYTLYQPYAAKVEATIYFTLTVEESLRRHALTDEHVEADDHAMNHEFLSGVNDAYHNHWRTLYKPFEVNGFDPPEQTTEKLRALLRL